MNRYNERAQEHINQQPAQQQERPQESQAPAPVDREAANARETEKIQEANESRKEARIRELAERFGGNQQAPEQQREREHEH